MVLLLIEGGGVKLSLMGREFLQFPTPTPRELAGKRNTYKKVIIHKRSILQYTAAIPGQMCLYSLGQQTHFIHCSHIIKAGLQVFFFKKQIPIRGVLPSHS